MIWDTSGRKESKTRWTWTALFEKGLANTFVRWRTVLSLLRGPCSHEYFLSVMWSEERLQLACPIWAYLNIVRAAAAQKPVHHGLQLPDKVPGPKWAHTACAIVASLLNRTSFGMPTCPASIPLTAVQTQLQRHWTRPFPGTCSPRVMNLSRVWLNSTQFCFN